MLGKLIVAEEHVVSHIIGFEYLVVAVDGVVYYVTHTSLSQQAVQVVGDAV